MHYVKHVYRERYWLNMPFYAVEVDAAYMSVFLSKYLFEILLSCLGYVAFSSSQFLFLQHNVSPLGTHAVAA